MLLGIIIPALNEEATVGEIIRRVLAAPLPVVLDRRVVIVVDDGSTDRTGEVAAAAGAKVVRHGRNFGVGRAFKSGLGQALEEQADLIVNIDADGQFNPDDIAKLIQPILDGHAGFVTASRFKDPALEPEMPKVKRWGNRQMSRLVSLLVGRTYHDVSCGFRAYSRETALRLNLWGEFTYTQETFLHLCACGIQIAEVPVPVRGVREIGESRVASNLWRYAQRTSTILFYAYRDFWPLRFFSALAVLFALPALACLIFLFQHWLRTGAFSPHIWAGFTGGGLGLLTLLCLVTGLLAGMLKRIRLNQEEMLYHLKKAHYSRNAARPSDQGVC